ncbi:tyrosine-type recombinase/integrase [Nonomuraea sp. NPDC049714]|uniref:tyrosine-type recombinase/integrase n=1 Tax=Nonomuraea sp. NPDC049714 TaxID=3364357 RepID=UPI00378EB256
MKLPQRCVTALRALWDHRSRVRQKDGDRWHDNDLVFAARTGTELSATDVRRVIERAGLVAQERSPRELRHSFVSLLSADGVPIEHIARLIGHAGGSAVTEKVYRQQIRPAMQEWAVIMDRIFPDPGHVAEGPASHSEDQEPPPGFGRRLLSWWAILGSNQ